MGWNARRAIKPSDSMHSMLLESRALEAGFALLPASTTTCISAGSLALHCSWRLATEDGFPRLKQEHQQPAADSFKEWTLPEERGAREQPRHHSASKSPERHHKATARKLGVTTSRIQDARDYLLPYQLGPADIPKPDRMGNNPELCFVHPAASALPAEVPCCVPHSSQSS